MDVSRQALAVGAVVLLLLAIGCREQAPEEAEAPGTTDLAVEVHRSAEELFTSTVVTYEVTVANDGPDSATDVHAVISLPDELTFVDADADCDEESDREVTCALGEIPAHESATITTAAHVEPGSADPTTVRYEVAVENRAGDDPDPDNNRAIDEVEYPRR